VGLGDHGQAMIWLNNAYKAQSNPSRRAPKHLA
jgi:hypothetical protein